MITKFKKKEFIEFEDGIKFKSYFDVKPIKTSYDFAMMPNEVLPEIDFEYLDLSKNKQLKKIQLNFIYNKIESDKAEYICVVKYENNNVFMFYVNVDNSNDVEMMNVKRYIYSKTNFKNMMKYLYNNYDSYSMVNIDLHKHNEILNIL